MSLESKLLAIQKDLPSLKKSAENPHFRNTYVPLETVLSELLPKLNDAGILVLQAPSLSLGAGSPGLTTTLVDTESTDRLEWTVPLVLDKQTPQAVGSAITYMRRYSLMSILGLVGAPDDDGEGALSDASKASRTAPKATQTSTRRSTPEF